ncbi:hypothetical protein ACFQ0Q_26110 [Streptomyces aureus]
MWAVGTCLALATLTACAGFASHPEPTGTALPSEVPSTPTYATAKAVVRAMGQAGLDCATVRSRDYDGSSTADCVATVDGVKAENEISVFDPDDVSKTEIGTSIESRRTGAYAQTLVAAGNWYIRVMDPPSAPAIAKALRAVVLDAKGKGSKTPSTRSRTSLPLPPTRRPTPWPTTCPPPWAASSGRPRAPEASSARPESWARGTPTARS